MSCIHTRIYINFILPKNQILENRESVTMLRRAALAFLFATVCAVSAGDVSESVDFDVISANSDVDKFAQHPETRAEIEQTPDGFRFTYKFGNRSNGL